MDINLNLDGPYSPEATLRAAAMVAEGIRYLNLATLHHEALADPADADALIGEIGLAASRLPQLLTQIAARLETERAADRISITDGEYAGNPAFATVAAHIHLDAAAAQAEALRAEVASAAAVTAHMAVRDDGTEEGSGND